MIEGALAISVIFSLMALALVLSHKPQPIAHIHFHKPRKPSLDDAIRHVKERDKKRQKRDKHGRFTRGK